MAGGGVRFLDIIVDDYTVTYMKQIPNAPNYYASEAGEIFSRPRLKSRTNGPMKANRTKSGYLQIGFYVDGKHFTKKVHQLVSAAYLGACPPRYVVNHKNGIKTDNRPSNLEYVTLSENKKHSLYVLGKGMGSHHGLSVLNEDKARRAFLEMRNGASIRGTARKYGVSQCCMQCLQRGITWKTVTARLFTDAS